MPSPHPCASPRRCRSSFRNLLQQFQLLHPFSPLPFEKICYLLHRCWSLLLLRIRHVIVLVKRYDYGFNNFNRKEAVRMIRVGLVCTNASPSLRPMMSEAVQMLEGEMEITEVIMSGPAVYGHDLNFSKLMESTSTSGYNDLMFPFHSETATLNSTTELSSSSL
ncbi:unnamed protein product [Microthlaspi erraticum]|uniref:Serine-threonine/tyrosine-protein kinase catalytic domain-containing protein n=1 Tax=Microthlaspi erraticum TaxID=1685480 RepID=A0A6D2IJX3_9BRAS|nr:unnamed protein product [Microthlaspi erraticum]